MADVPSHQVTRIVGGVAGTPEDLTPPEPHRLAARHRRGEVTLEVDVPGPSVVVEEPPVELQVHAVRRVPHVSIDRPAGGVTNLPFGSGQSVRPFDPGEVAVLQG